MKFLLHFVMAVISVTLVSGTSIPLGGGKAIAVHFDQKEVDQSKYIAIAMPLVSGYYKLIVLEQISLNHACWKETGSEPTVVDPLLVKFNFTRLCRRYMDSNGFSIRVAGEDLAMKYSPRLEQQKGEIVLVGRSSAGPMMLIGRTRGIANGFLKLVLEPGWRFSRRVFKGKTLGHVYFMNDSIPLPLLPS